MATLGVAVGGAVAGGVIGGLVPGVGVLLGVQLGFLGGAILGNILFPTEIDVGGPARDDVRITSNARSRFIPFGYATIRVAGHATHLLPPRFVDTTTTEGGKGGGPEISTTTTSVFLSWTSGFVEGPAVAITRIWVDSDLIFNVLPDNADAVLSARILEGLLSQDASLAPNTSFDDGVQIAQTQAFGPLRIYLGGEDNPLEPMIQNDLRIGESFAGLTDPWGNVIDTSQNSDFVMPFHGLVQIAFDDINGEAVNNHFPQVEAEILMSGSQSFSSESYEPVPCRSMRLLASDLVTQVCFGSQFSSGYYMWNTIDKNAADPEHRFFDAGIAADSGALVPRQVGIWDDPELRVLFVKGTGNTTFSLHSATSGALLLPPDTYSGLAGAQPLSAFYGPVSSSPSLAIILAESTDEITSLGLNWSTELDLDDDLAGVVQIEDPAIPGTSIATASFNPDWGGFFGPDGMFYVVVGETTSSNKAIAVFDPETLDVVGALEPYITSPPEDDDAWSFLVMTYDKVSDKIILMTANGLRRVDRATLTLDPLPDLPPSSSSFSAAGDNNQLIMQRGPFFGRLWVQVGAGNQYEEFDVWNWLGPLCSFEGSSDAGLGINNEVPVYDPANGTIWTQDFFNTDLLNETRVCRVGPNCVTAESIAADISDRCEVPSDLRLTTGWSSKVICGYLVGRQISGRKALEPIAGAINGDFRTQDGKVEFFLLDSGSIKTIPEDDLGAAEEIDAQVPGRDIRWPYERELPRRVDVQFIDRMLDFDSNTVGFDRPQSGFKGRGNETVQIPIVFDTPSDPQPDEIAERLLMSFDLHREKHLLQLTWEHLNLNVGDAFQYVKGNFTHTVRAEKFALSENNMVIIEARSEDFSVNTPSGQDGVITPVVFEPPTLSIPGPSQLFIIDAALLRDQDDDSTDVAVYVAGAGITAAPWPGGNLQRSTDGGTTWQHVETISSDSGVSWGRTTAALGDTSRPHAYDRTNTVAVNMVRGILPGSVAETDLDDDADLNAVLVGRAGRWEVLRYATAVNTSGSPDDAGDSYTLSNLRRAQRGTNLNTGNHQSGDLLLLLEPAKLRRILVPTTDLNVQVKYRLVTIGQTPSLATPLDFTLAGESAKPLSLWDVQGSRELSTGTWTVSATRRTRRGGEWVDFIDVPLSEDSPDFECEALSGPGGSVIATKANLTLPSTTFTADDLGVSPESDSPFALTVRWYQLSARVGRGNTEEVTLTSPTPGHP